jgi:fumarate hydratase subunit alpha
MIVMIGKSLVKNTVVELLRLAVTKLPADIEEVLQKAYESEEDNVPKMQLKTILDNIKLAEDAGIPMCQDTGIPIFYVNIGKLGIENIDIEDAIREGVAEATTKVPLRPNAVHPITRKNPGNNVGERMPYINFKYSANDYIEITVMPKGAGSENMSALAMLTPSKGIKGIKEFVLNTVLKAGSNPCPPIILGIGIGGSADISMKLAKESLLRPVTQRHSDKEIAALEEELYREINKVGIGPMGLGGKTTLLGVNIEYGYCHTASLPVAINIQCWAARRATARIYKNGKVKYASHKRP